MNQHNDDQRLNALLSKHLQHDPPVFDKEHWAEVFMNNANTKPHRIKVPKDARVRLLHLRK